MKRVLMLVVLTISATANADVTCSGVPQRVYAGAHGPNDAGSKLWVVFSPWQAYVLGPHSDSLAKARFSLAQTAFAMGKTLELSFWSHSSCEQARADAAVPSAMAIVQ